MKQLHVRSRAAHGARRAAQGAKQAVWRVSPRAARVLKHVRDVSAPTFDLGERLAAAEAALRTQSDLVAEHERRIAELNWDLNESRRLNLRAAELLDVVAETLVTPSA